MIFLNQWNDKRDEQIIFDFKDLKGIDKLILTDLSKIIKIHCGELG